MAKKIRFKHHGHNDGANIAVTRGNKYKNIEPGEELELVDEEDKRPIPAVAVGTVSAPYTMLAEGWLKYGQDQTVLTLNGLLEMLIEEDPAFDPEINRDERVDALFYFVEEGDGDRPPARSKR